MVFRNCLILFSLLWVSSICLVMYPEFVDILDGVWPAKIKIKNFIDVVLYFCHYILSTNLISQWPHYIVVSWTTEIPLQKIPSYFTLDWLGLFLFIRKSVMNWPTNERDIIVFHHQKVQGGDCLVHMLTGVIKIPFPSVHPSSVLAAFSDRLSSHGSKWLWGLQPKSFLVHIHH